jgi:hypothetical protein
MRTSPERNLRLAYEGGAALANDRRKRYTNTKVHICDNQKD